MRITSTCALEHLTALPQFRTMKSEKDGTMNWPELPNRVRESLKTLSCLAETRKPTLARDIASHAGLPPAQTAKLLQLLTWGGFVKSRRGSKGGFWLAMPPERIRVKDVICFFEPGFLSSKSPEDPISRRLVQATACCRHKVATITIADLIETRNKSQREETAHAI